MHNTKWNVWYVHIHILVTRIFKSDFLVSNMKMSGFADGTQEVLDEEMR